MPSPYPLPQSGGGDVATNLDPSAPTRHVARMSDHVPPELDMRADGSFRLPPQPPRPPLLTRIFIWAVVIAVITGGLAAAAFALWLALILVPVALLAGVIAWLAFRFQLWRARGSVSGQRDVWRR